MDQFFEALEKSKNSIALNIVEQMSFDETADVLEKGKKASVGEIRDWNGIKYQKQSNGSWNPIKKNRTEKDSGGEADSVDITRDNYEVATDKLDKHALREEHHRTMPYEGRRDLDEKATFEGNLPTNGKKLLYEIKDSAKPKIEVEKIENSFSVSFVDDKGKRTFVSKMDEVTTRDFLKDYTEVD